MYNEVFIRDFSTLGVVVNRILEGSVYNELLNRAFEDSMRLNPLFSTEMQKEALKAISVKFLSAQALECWLEKYKGKLEQRNQTVGIVMAGNIPLVGFHDFLTALASGCMAQIKLSAKDRFLLPALFEILCEINSYWKDRVKFIDGLPEDADIIFATGSDESAAVFESRYKKANKIIRGSRSSLAVLKGNETEDDLMNLCKDCFLYFGLGCRNVSNLLVPEGYDFKKLLEAFSYMEPTFKNEEFAACYKYQKALARMHGEWYADGGYFILRKFRDLYPPMSVINVMQYSSFDQMNTFLESNKMHIQCVISSEKVKFGEAQYPALDDYADGVNSLEFILKLVNFAQI